MKRGPAIGLVAGALVFGAGGLAAGRYVVPTSSAHSVSSTTTTAPVSPPTSPVTTATTPAPATTLSGQTLPIAVQPTSDGASDTSTVLMPTSCVLRGSTVTATGTTSFVAEGYLRLGDVVELYVYSAPASGYPDGYQLGYLGQEKAPYLAGGSGQSWTATVPVDTSLGAPVRCAVSVQATHQFEDAPSAY